VHSARRQVTQASIEQQSAKQVRIGFRFSMREKTLNPYENRQRRNTTKEHDEGTIHDEGTPQTRGAQRAPIVRKGKFDKRDTVRRAPSGARRLKQALRPTTSRGRPLGAPTKACIHIALSLGDSSAKEGSGG